MNVPFSPRIFLTLLAVFALSVWMFARVAKHATTRRRWMGLYEWARLHGMKLRRFDVVHLPEPLRPLGGSGRVLLTSKDLTIVQLRTTLAGEEGITHDDVSPQRARWNVLVKKREGVHPPAALRPAHAERSLADLFALSDFPTLSSADRFVVRGLDHASARALAATKAMSVVPADVGLVISGAYIILDFSHRPFDPIEFDRMIDVASQLQATA